VRTQPTPTVLRGHDAERRWSRTSAQSRPQEESVIYRTLEVCKSSRPASSEPTDNFRADVFAKAVKRAAAKAQPARRADFERLEFHDLRNTFASLMIAASANPLQLADALGHTDKTGRPDPTFVWRRYGHLYPGSTREAAAALDRHLAAVAS
jgi:integrase